MRTGSTVSIAQSISNAWPSTPAAMHSGSMIPHGTPVARCSACRHSSASEIGVPSKPRASALATSSAALLARPAPIGMLVDTRPAIALACGPSSAATPATRRPHAGSTSAADSTGRSRSTLPDSESDTRSIRPSVRSPSTTVQRSIVIGSTRPPV